MMTQFYSIIEYHSFPLQQCVKHNIAAGLTLSKPAALMGEAMHGLHG